MWETCSHKLTDSSDFPLLPSQKWAPVGGDRVGPPPGLWRVLTGAMNFVCHSPVDDQQSNQDGLMYRSLRIQ